jgi:hypothetical protein
VTPCEITFVRDFPAEYERFIDRAKGMGKADASMIAEPRTSQQLAGEGIKEI